MLAASAPVVSMARWRSGSRKEWTGHVPRGFPAGILHPGRPRACGDLHLGHLRRFADHRQVHGIDPACGPRPDRPGHVLSEATVKTHVARILGKLGLRARVQAVILGYETGLISPAHPEPG